MRVVGDRAVDGVLEVEHARVGRRVTIRLRGMIVAMHVDRRLRQIVREHQLEHARRAPRSARHRASAPRWRPTYQSGNSIEFARQQRFVVRRQHAGPARELPAQQRVDRVAEQRVRAVGVRAPADNSSVPRSDSSRNPRVEILRRSPRGTLSPASASKPRDCTNGPAILVRGRRVHHDERLARAAHAKIAPEARIGRSGFEFKRRCAQPALDPALELTLSVHAAHCLIRESVRFYHSSSTMLIMRNFCSRSSVFMMLCACGCATAADDTPLGLKPSRRHPAQIAAGIYPHTADQPRRRAAVRGRGQHPGTSRAGDRGRRHRAPAQARQGGVCRLAALRPGARRKSTRAATCASSNAATRSTAPSSISISIPSAAPWSSPSTAWKSARPAAAARASGWCSKARTQYRMRAAITRRARSGNDDWFVRAQGLQIDKSADVGTARERERRISRHADPVYAVHQFLARPQRKSGFLTPTFGTTGKPARNSRCLLLEHRAQLRCDDHAARDVQARRPVAERIPLPRAVIPRRDCADEVLPNDRVRGRRTRMRLSLVHNQVFSNGWAGAVNVQKVSDDNYFTDFSTQITATSQVLLPRDGSARERRHAGQRRQLGIVDEPRSAGRRCRPIRLNPVTPPYDRCPGQLERDQAHCRRSPIRTLQATYVAFHHPTLINGSRAFAYPSVSLPLQTSYAYVTPKVGMHMTHYDFDQTNTPLARPEPHAADIFGWTAALSSSGHDVVRRAPACRRSSPSSSTSTFRPATRTSCRIRCGLQNINFATMYTENQFSGNDRINDANQITTGITSRSLQTRTASSACASALAQRYYFKTQEVTLPGVTAARQHKFRSAGGAVAARLSRTGPPMWAGSTRPICRRPRRLNVGVRYEPQPGKVVNVAYRYTNGGLVSSTGDDFSGHPSNTLRQTDISAQWPLSRQLDAPSRA